MDVNDGDWFEPYVQYVYEKGLMTGLDKTHFGPAAELSRAQLVVILYRLEGSPEVTYTAKFTDVGRNEFYTNAVVWASEQGIVTGYEGTGLFAPSKMISREELVVMLYRYAKYCKTDINGNGDLSKFQDGASVSPFAIDAMRWAIEKEIIVGDQGKLRPQDSSNRVEGAVVLQRFLETIL